MKKQASIGLEGSVEVKKAPSSQKRIQPKSHDNRPAHEREWTRNQELYFRYGLNWEKYK